MGESATCTRSWGAFWTSTLRSERDSPEPERSRRSGRERADPKSGDRRPSCFRPRAEGRSARQAAARRQSPARCRHRQRRPGRLVAGDLTNSDRAHTTSRRPQFELGERACASASASPTSRQARDVARFTRQCARTGVDERCRTGVRPAPRAAVAGQPAEAGAMTLQYTAVRYRQLSAAPPSRFTSRKAQRREPAAKWITPRCGAPPMAPAFPGGARKRRPLGTRARRRSHPWDAPWPRSTRTLVQVCSLSVEVAVRLGDQPVPQGHAAEGARRRGGRTRRLGTSCPAAANAA